MQDLEKALGVFRVLETGDVQLARAVAAPTFTNREASVAPLACSRPGPAGLLASGAWMRSAFDLLHFHIIQAGIDSGTAWVHLRMQGIQNRPFVQFDNGQLSRIVPATGSPIDFEQIHVLTVDSSGVTTHAAVRDDMTMLNQLGVMPPKPRFVLDTALLKLTGRAREAASAVTAAADQAADAA